MIFKMKIKLAITALCAALLTGCGVAIKYSLSGASIPPDARTFSVAYFPNNATMVAPILSSTLTDALVDMFTRRTRLMQVEEGGDFSASVLRHLKEKLAQFKKEDDHLYAIYGTPAESLCATQARQYDRFCRDEGVENVFRSTEHYSPEYFTNSFHVNVTEDITPFEKQDREFTDFHLCEGGHIQYVRLDNPENFEAVKAVIRRGMKKGFYQGVNFDSAYCGDCGRHSTNVLFKCPHCGSANLSVISRVCGYLGYSNVNGMSRMNDGKMAEIRNRKSM